jgi:hypothetical protein
MLDIFSAIDSPNFFTAVIEKKEDLWPAFKSFLSKDKINAPDSSKKLTSEGAASATP